MNHRKIYLDRLCALHIPLPIYVAQDVVNPLKNNCLVASVQFSYYGDSCSFQIPKVTKGCVCANVGRLKLTQSLEAKFCHHDVLPKDSTLQIQNYTFPQRISSRSKRTRVVGKVKYHTILIIKNDMQWL